MFVFQVFLKLSHFEILNQRYEQYIANVIKCQKVVRGFLLRKKLLRQAKHFANERHSLFTHIHLTGKRTIEKLVALPMVNVDRRLSLMYVREDHLDINKKY